MCVLIFSTAFSETYLVLRRNERDRYKMCIGTPYSFKILTTLEFSQQIFEKYTNTKFIENPSSGNRVVPCGTDRQTDGFDTANSCCSQFRARPSTYA